MSERRARAQALAALAIAGLHGCQAAPTEAPRQHGASESTALAPGAPPRGAAGATAAAGGAGAALKPRDACCMGRNPCRGRGGCAVPESHDCAGKNECEGRGGCNAHCPK